MTTTINVLIIASAENRQMKKTDLDDEVPDLIDEHGNIEIDYKTQLEMEKELYFRLISSLFDDHCIIKYMTIDPVYDSNLKIKDLDDPNYLGHLDTLLSEIDIVKYKNLFDCIFVTNAYHDMFCSGNILILDKLLKETSYLITMHPTGYSELVAAKYIYLMTDRKFNIYKK